VKTWVKICGITRVGDAEAAVEAGADAIGINFVARSPRCCAHPDAARIVEAVGDAVAVYGVFANAGRGRIEETVRRVGLHGVQFHGAESDEEMSGWDVPVIRAIAVDSAETARRALAAARGYRVLLDSPRGGGSGKRFDVRFVRGFDLSEAIVAGGLTPENVAEVVRQLAPWGVDTAGGVERAPGIKDRRLIEEFIEHATSP
jgi:phosphoribosylanthranilate isomerase